MKCRVFEHPNLDNGWKCVVCHASNDAPVILVPIHGTSEDGIVQAEQVHENCILDNVIFFRPRPQDAVGFIGLQFQPLAE